MSRLVVIADALRIATRCDCWCPVFLGLQAMLLVGGVLIHSPTRDEIVHLDSGICLWRTGSNVRNLGNPPLCDLLAALPVTVLYPQLSVPTSGHYLDIEAHRDDPAQYRRAIILSRFALIPFSMLGGVVCYCWSCDLAGRFAARVALALWCTCPNVLAFGQIVTGDLTCAATGILAGYVVWKWLDQPDFLGTLVAGVAVGTAMLAKMIWVVWLGVVPLLWFAWIGWDRPRRASKIFWGLLQLGLLLLMAVFWVNLGYGFEETCRPFPTDRMSRIADGSQWAAAALAKLPIPLPANYLRGMHDAHEVMTSNQTSYLRGELRGRGWWYYYLYGMAVKIPLGTLALAVLALWHLPLRTARGRDLLVLLIPATVLTILVSMLDGLSGHFRYILPLFPFVFVALSVAANALRQKVVYGKWVVAICVGATTLSSLAHYPHSLSYFNELAGGPSRGHRHLIDSSIDWGQDLLLLKHWLDRHPEASPLYLAYCGSVAPQFAEIEFSVPPPGPRIRDSSRDAEQSDWKVVAGWYAVSVNLICGRPSQSVDAEGRPSSAERDKFAYFQLLEPVARIGHSIWIYHVDGSDAAQLRRSFGWSDDRAPAENPRFCR